MYIHSPWPVPSLCCWPSPITTQSYRLGPDLGEESQICLLGGCLLTTYVPNGNFSVRTPAWNWGGQISLCFMAFFWARVMVLVWGCGSVTRRLGDDDSSTSSHGSMAVCHCERACTCCRRRLESLLIAEWNVYEVGDVWLLGMLGTCAGETSRRLRTLNSTSRSSPSSWSSSNLLTMVSRYSSAISWYCDSVISAGTDLFGSTIGLTMWRLLVVDRWHLGILTPNWCNPTLWEHARSCIGAALGANRARGSVFDQIPGRRIFLASLFKFLPVIVIDWRRGRDGKWWEK